MNTRNFPANEYPELSGKRLELLKELSPAIRRVLVAYDPGDASPRQGLLVARQASAALGAVLVEREARTRTQLLEAIAGSADVDAYLSIPGGFPTGHYRTIIRLANARRLPSIFHTRSESTADALISYGASDSDAAREAARLVDRILRGADAGRLPVERPAKLQLVINLRTAKQIGVTVPPSLLARAERVIR